MKYVGIVTYCYVDAVEAAGTAKCMRFTVDGSFSWEAEQTFPHTNKVQTDFFPAYLRIYDASGSIVETALRAISGDAE